MRTLLGIFTVALAFAHLSATLHFALVAHTLCVEHGQWVDGSAHIGELHQSAESNTATISASEERLSHDHCDFSALPRQELAILQSSGVDIAAAPCQETLSAFRHGAFERFGEPILSFAPKLSPPV